MKTAIDTSAYSAMHRGHAGVSTVIRESEGIILSSVVVGELLFGFRAGQRYQKNLHELQKFVESPYVSLVPVTWTTADRYSRIALALRKKGKPIPSNDIWIAAHAMETGADLLSFDDHFGWIDGLAWVKPQ